MGIKAAVAKAAEHYYLEQQQQRARPLIPTLLPSGSDTDGSDDDGQWTDDEDESDDELQTGEETSLSPALTQRLSAIEVEAFGETKDGTPMKRLTDAEFYILDIPRIKKERGELIKRFDRIEKFLKITPGEAV